MSMLQFNKKHEQGKSSIFDVILIQARANSKLGYPPELSIMPFGKYKGLKLKDIPLEYLEWINRRTWLKGKVKGIINEYVNSNMS